MKVHLDDLIRKRACWRQVEWFRQHFGEEAEVTRENLLKAADLEFHLFWLLRNFFPNDFPLHQEERRLWEEMRLQQAASNTLTEENEVFRTYNRKVAELIWRHINE